MPCCVPHHDQFHALLRAAGVDLRYTSDTRERHTRALKALQICAWMLLEAQEHANTQEIIKCRKSSTKKAFPKQPLVEPEVDPIGWTKFRPSLDGAAG